MRRGHKAYNTMEWQLLTQPKHQQNPRASIIIEFKEEIEQN